MTNPEPTPQISATVVPVEKMGLGKFQNRAKRVLAAASAHGRISPRAIASFIPRELSLDRERFSTVITLVYAFLASQQILVTPDSQAVDDYKQEIAVLEQEKMKFRKRTSRDTRRQKGYDASEDVPEDLEFLDDDRLFGYTTPSSYLVKLKWIPLLTREQEQELGKAILKGDIQARDTLVVHNLRLVLWVSRRYVGWPGTELDDLIQEGNLGLIKAAEKYNWEMGRFTTYAVWWIRQSIERSIKDKRDTIRLPVHIHEFRSKIYTASVKLETEFGREPTTEEIGKEIHVPKEKIEWLAHVIKETETLSLDMEIDPHSSKQEGGLSSLTELLMNTSTIDPDVYVEAKEELVFAKEKVHTLLDTIANKLALSDRYQLIFKSFYGLNHSEGRRTLEKVGLQFNVSRERIRQIIAEIWCKTSAYGFDMDHNLLRAELARIFELEKFVSVAETN